MASFIQQTEGARPVGIGDQQIIRKDLSFIDTAAQGLGQLVQATDIAGTAIGENKAKALVQDAQRQVDSELAESEELARLNSLGDNTTVDQLRRKVSLLEKGVSTGKISRDNARLRVADLVAQGIQEAPLFSDKIRQSASRLLGFDPTSEGVRQFFSAFQTEEDLARQNVEKNKFLKAGMDLAAVLGGSPATYAALAANNEVAKLNLDLSEARFKEGQMSSSRYIGERVAFDRVDSTQRVMMKLKGMQLNNQDINADILNSTILEEENAAINSILVSMRAAGQLVDSKTAADVAAQVKPTYDLLREYTKGKDTSVLLGKDLERLAIAQKAWGAEHLPVMTALSTMFGERVTDRLLSMVEAAGGSEQELNNLFTVTPALKPLASLLTGDSTALPNLIRSTMTKLQDGTARTPDGSPNLTQEETVIVDALEQEASKSSSTPEDKSTVADLLSDNGLPNRAASVILSGRASLAAPQHKTFVKNQWNTIRSTMPDRIIDAIRNTPATKAKPYLTVNEKGLGLKADTAGRGTIQPVDHEAWNLVQSINKYLFSVPRGWGEVMGVTDVQKEAKDIANYINTTMQGGFLTEEQDASIAASLEELTKNISEERLAELRAEAKRRAGK